MSSTSARRIRVLVVDDHPVVRRGLSELIDGEPEFELVAAVGDGAEAVLAARSAHPDVILMDISMPGMDGMETTRRLLHDRPETRVIMLTSFFDHQKVLDAVDSGAIGYLLKDSDSDELLRGVRSAAAGHSPLSPKAARALITSRQARHPLNDLTQRETEVLRLVAEGLANGQVAARLGISEKTVKAHLTSVFQRIGVVDRTQAALWAQRHGLA